MTSSLLGSALESAVRSLLLAGVVWAGLRSFRVRSVLAQKMVWGLVLAAAVFMPFLLPLAARWQKLPIGATVVLPSAPLKFFRTASPARVPTAVASESLDRSAVANVLPTAAPLNVTASSKQEDNIGDRIPDETRFAEPDARAFSNAESVVPMAQAHAKPARTPRQPITIVEFAWMLYLSVTAGLLLRLVYGLATAFQLWRAAEPISMGPQCEIGAVHLRSSGAVASPVTIGSGMVLPADYVNWDEEKLRIVLAHERSHIRQGDFYLQLLAGLYAVLFWFSPLGWWLKHKLSELAEAISDRAGLCEAASRTSYARILLEFAATPRPTHLGVAMARSGSLSRRIDRVLNDRAFQQAFAASRPRVAAAVLLVPIALFASTSLVRVQAAGQAAQTPTAKPAPAAAQFAAPEAAPVPSAAPETGQSNPPAELILASPQAPSAPGAEMQVVVPPIPPIGPIHVVVPGVTVVMPKTPPLPPMRVVVPRMDVMMPKTPPLPPMRVVVPRMDVVMPKIAPMPEMNVAVPKTVIVMPKMPKVVIQMPELAKLESLHLMGPGVYAVLGPNVILSANGAYVYRYSTDGDMLVLVKRNGGNEQLSASWADGHRESIEKARKLAHGDFLWFTHKGRSYFIDDPAIVSSIEASMDAVHAQQEELGKEQELLGRRQEALATMQEEMSRRQVQASIPTPDMNKEIAQVEAALAELKAKEGKSMSNEEWAEIESKLGELQARLGAMRGEMGAKMGAFGERQGALGGQQRGLGEQQGWLGERQARLALEMQTKVNSVIYQSLQNGKAHPVK